eukprot:jgi/Bigna1/70923/fgenesh1_pg.13_\
MSYSALENRDTIVVIFACQSKYEAPIEKAKKQKKARDGNEPEGLTPSRRKSQKTERLVNVKNLVAIGRDIRLADRLDLEEKEPLVLHPRDVFDQGTVFWTKIQAGAIPLLLKGRDVVVRATTDIHLVYTLCAGSGKTLAYLVPWKRERHSLFSIAWYADILRDDAALSADDSKASEQQHLTLPSPPSSNDMIGMQDAENGISSTLKGDKQHAYKRGRLSSDYMICCVVLLRRSTNKSEFRDGSTSVSEGMATRAVVWEGHRTVQELIQDLREDDAVKPSSSSSPSSSLSLPLSLLRNDDRKVTGGGANLAVGTPGLDMLVLDEADRLLGMGFESTLLAILRRFPRNTASLQMGLFSATDSYEGWIMKKAGLQLPVRVAAESLKAAAINGSGRGNNSLKEMLRGKSSLGISAVRKKLAARSLLSISARDHSPRNAIAALRGREDKRKGGREEEEKEEDEGHAATRLPVSLQNFYRVEKADQMLVWLLQFLSRELSKEEAKVIVFASTCAMVDYLAMLVDIFLSPSEEGLGAAEDNQQDPHSPPPAAKSGERRNGIKGGGQQQQSRRVWKLHSKMNSEKRMRGYREFLTGRTGVLLCTDVAARGVDIPDADTIVQFQAPQDPDLTVSFNIFPIAAMYVHRVGRVSRMGESGKAIILLSEDERKFIDYLSLQGVPATAFATPAAASPSSADDGDDEGDRKDGDKNGCTSNTSVIVAGGGGGGGGEHQHRKQKARIKAINRLTANEACRRIQRCAVEDRAIMIKGQEAFVSYVRAYQEHKLSYIFSMANHDWAGSAKMLGLLALPRLPDLKKLNIKYRPAPVDISQIAFKNPEREAQRLQQLEAKHKSNEAQKKERIEKERLLERARQKRSDLRRDRYDIKRRLRAKQRKGVNREAQCPFLLHVMKLRKSKRCVFASPLLSSFTCLFSLGSERTMTGMVRTLEEQKAVILSSASEKLKKGEIDQSHYERVEEMLEEQIKTREPDKSEPVRISPRKRQKLMKKVLKGDVASQKTLKNDLEDLEIISQFASGFDGG